jgi:hypothetical protein
MRIEASIQRHLVAWIKETYPQAKCIATLNENNRHCMDMGCDEGITDLLIMERRTDGLLWMLFLELKKKKGKLSESEIKWAKDYHINFASKNTVYAVAYGFSAAKEIIEQFFHLTSEGIMPYR